MIYVDDRRVGEHGIGRFARQVLKGLDYTPVPLRTDPDSPLDPVRLTRALSKLKSSDLFFSPGYNPPLHCAAPFIITLHDLNHLDQPENSSPLKRLYYAMIVKRACHLAACVLTVSEFSRSRIIEWSGIPPNKVVNVSSGVGPEFNPLVAPYEFSTPYILCVSNRKKHKNDLRHIEGYAKSGLKKELCLVFTGSPTSDLMDCIHRNQVTGHVHFLGPVPEERLASLYRGAEALLFASLYEGFGLPVVEAMACGTPVLTSTTTALQEIAGDAALLVDPTSVDQIAVALERIIHDSLLRRQLREKGLLRAALFTWDKTRAMVQEILIQAATTGSDRQN